MALWRRFGIGVSESFIYCRKEMYFPAGCVAGGLRVLEGHFSQRKPIFCYTHFRTFMAAGQVKPKPKADVKVGGGDWQKPKVEDHGGIRLNEAIREPEVRLVTDQGHRIVTIQEALFLARKHDLDLVEVQRKVKVEGGSQSPVFKPAVCKLIDYSKEKYKQEQKGKERLKSNGVIALRNGENKEVRFKAKTEHKDLKLKAETVKRLMERGYRVKCTAMHTGKDDEDLGALLLNLVQLIEDISVVESGPHLDTKNAYVILRHIKFTSKKGNKVGKATETVRSVLSARPVAAPVTSSAGKGEDGLSTEEWETVGSDSETEIKGPSKQLKENTEPVEDRKAETGFSTRHERSNFGGTIPIPVSQTSERPEQSNRYQNASSSGAFSGKRDGRLAMGNQGRMREQAGNNGSRDRSVLNPKDRPARTYNPGSSSTPRYGVFKPAETSDSNTPDGTRPRYGVFSPVKSPPPVDNRVNGPASPAPSYGIFSTPRNIPSDDRMKQRLESSNGSTPSPRFGSFTSSKKT